MAALAGAVLLELCAACGSLRSEVPSDQLSTGDSVLVTVRLARFDRATAVAVDPSGDVLVSDARRNAVLRLDRDGREVEALGGPGSDAARFDGPMGLDATNGLVLLVADAGNGRVQRFSRGGRFLELMPIAADPDRTVADPEYLERDVRLTDASDGRPVDVASTDDGRLFVIESRSATIRTWERERRPGPPIGASVGDAMPVRPVALATDGVHVFVADPGLPGIVVLDRFGRPTRSMGRGLGDDIRSVAFGAGCVWLLLSDAVAGFSPEGVLLVRYRLDASSPAVDLAVRDTTAYVLTAGGLYTGTVECPTGM